jgi:Mrp family chromosome partitioning ATPase
MERIQAAIQKAKEQRGEAPLGAAAPAAPVRGVGPRPARAPAVDAGPAWAALPAFAPDPARLERARVVTFDDVDPAHVAFDMMRTKLVRAMKANGWVAIGITSPTAGCGKTTVALNLAFSLAHQPDLRVALVDLDLRRPSVARALGLGSERSTAALLRGEASPAESFVRCGEALAVAASTEPAPNSGDLLGSAAAAAAAAAIRATFAPDVILYDLPPMLQSDDAMAFLPQLDCALLVAGAERSRIDEVDKCEQDLSQHTNLLGITLNKCRYVSEDYGLY